MPEDLESLVGQTGEPVSITLDAARVVEYCNAVGETNPIYPSTVEGAEGKPIPPTFAAVYALGAGSVSLVQAGYSPQRLIHGEQSFTWGRALKVGETVTSQGRIAAAYKKRSLQFVEAETVVTDASGEEVCRSTATVLVLPEGGQEAGG